MQHRAQIEWEKLEKLTESFPKKVFLSLFGRLRWAFFRNEIPCDYGDTSHSLLEQNNEERDFLL